MFRKLILLLSTSIFLAGCTNNAKPNKILSTGTLRDTNVITKKETIVPLTDSAKLVKHLDSLPKVALPCKVDGWNYGEHDAISLSEFKNKKLFKLFYKLIPREIGGSGIDMYGNVDSTFNLCDTNYKANWILVTKTPRFFVVEMDENYLLLVALDYQLNVLDAIHIAAGDPLSNSHFQGELTSTIYKNLKIALHYTYYVQTDEKGNFDRTDEDDIWHIDKNGRFKPIRYAPNGRSLTPVRSSIICNNS